LEKNFWDVCVYELSKIKFDGAITNIANEIILARRNFNQKKFPQAREKKSWNGRNHLVYRYKINEHPRPKGSPNGAVSCKRCIVYEVRSDKEIY
jgi:hypothetical protein